MISVGIVGGTGYTGIELLRLLANHPNAQVKIITSRTESGMQVGEVYPSLHGLIDLKFSEPEIDELSECDLIFFATPNGIAMKSVPTLISRGCRVIDLSADFRIKDAHIFEKWYEMEHQCHDFLEQAVYGLPEINRQVISSANLVANPGCYPTATILGFLPLLKNKSIKTNTLIADCKSGVSGAGKNLNSKILMSELSENFRAYNVAGHRHKPEIEQAMEAVSEKNINLTFVPHLVPMIRGIHATLYCDSSLHLTETHALYYEAFKNENFVKLLPLGEHPETASVRGSNICQISLHKQTDTNSLIILSVIDNLVKGASGQAVQNMNIMFGFKETAGLDQFALVP